MSDRLRHGVGSALTLAGAFAIGIVIREVLVLRAMAATAPGSVFGVLGGLALIALGRRLERRYEVDIRPAADEAETEDEFDEEMAPFDTADLETYEKDET